eukprot:GHVS01041630.1.p1 GENE.GHVS01041630.1~~GHVS01041630.1.p1  ORF type:complete len:102 (+),score=28.41 GHVS01041630.1:207-512(+)
MGATTTSSSWAWLLLLVMLMVSCCPPISSSSTNTIKKDRRRLGAPSVHQRLYLTSLLGLFPIKTVLTKQYVYAPTSIWQLKSPCCEVPYNTTGRWNGTAWT